MNKLIMTFDHILIAKSTSTMTLCMIEMSTSQTSKIGFLMKKYQSSRNFQTSFDHL